MVKTKSEILKLLKKHNDVNRSAKDIFIAEKNNDGYIISFVLIFNKNELIFVYDHVLGYVCFLK